MRAVQRPLTLLEAFGATLRRVRTDAGITAVFLAAVLGSNRTTVNRWEAGETWPHDPERTVAAYGHAAQVPAVAMWADALELWQRSHGEAGPQHPDVEQAIERLRRLQRVTPAPR